MGYLHEVHAPDDLKSTNRDWSEDEIQQRHTDLLNRPSDLTHLLLDRGLTIESINQFRIGIFQPGVYMIPVYDDLGHLLNVRYYAKRDHKKWGVKGKTTKLLYPWYGLNGANPLWIVEGEFDSQIAIQNGLHAITTTAGATATPSTLRYYSNVFGPSRRFILALDADEAGAKAAADIGMDVFPGRIDGIVRWPDSFTKDGHSKDISDWFNKHHTSEELQSCVVTFDESWASQVKIAVDSKIAKPVEWSAEDEKKLRILLASLGGPVPTIFADDPTLFATAPPATEQAATPSTEGNDGFDAATMWPETGFLRSYLDYAGGLTDAPDQFHAATALTVLGAATQRRFYYEFGNDRIYPNFYTALVAPSSVYRKTTSTKIGAKLLCHYNSALALPRDFSTESLMVHLAKQSPMGLLYYSELAELLNQFKRSYSEGMLALLTDFYDCPNKYERETQKEGLQTIENPFICILGASTIDWLNKNISEDQSEGGFWPRFLFFTARHRKPLMELPPKPDREQQYALIYALKELDELHGEMGISGAARSVYVEWAKATDAMADDPKLPKGLSKYIARIQPYVLKIAMLFELSESRELEISQVSIERSVKLMNWLTEQLVYLFKFEISHSKLQSLENKIISLLKAHANSMTVRDLLRSIYGISKRELTTAIENLKEKQYITVKAGHSHSVVVSLILASIP